MSVAEWLTSWFWLYVAGVILIVVPVRWDDRRRARNARLERRARRRHPTSGLWV